jgi:hypothetical protein
VQVQECWDFYSRVFIKAHLYAHFLQGGNPATGELKIQENHHLSNIESIAIWFLQITL